MRKPYDTALGPHNDWTYDKKFKPGRAGRRHRARLSREINRIARRRDERTWRADQRDQH